jgi:hypothetical protein
MSTIDKTKTDIKAKVIDILKNKRILEADIEVLKENKKMLTEFKYSSDDVIIAMIEDDYSRGNGAYNGDDIVVREVLHNEASKEITQRKIKKKREQIESDIEKCESILRYKKRLLNVIKITLNSLSEDDKLMIELNYIDRNFRKYSWLDIVNNYNENRIKRHLFSLSPQMIYKKKNDLIDNICDRLRNNSCIILYRIGG